MEGDGRLNMTLLLTGERDQALLALVIKEARQIADENKRYVGRTAIQKIMYFLKARGIPMNYKFDIYHYGPYCQDIITDTDWLIVDDVIRDQSTKPDNYSNYAPYVSMDEILEVISDLSSNERDIIRDTVKALIPLEPNLLELLATLDYLLRAEKATGRKTEIKETVVKRLMEVKGAKFEQNLVESMYDTVARIGELGS